MGLSGLLDKMRSDPIIEDKVSLPWDEEPYLLEDPPALASVYTRLESGREIQAIGKPRASSLYDCCIRYHVLGTKFKVTKSGYLGFRDRLLFGIGTAMHEWLQNDPSIFGNRRRGIWRCRACGNTTKFGPPPAINCTKCGGSHRAFVYQEFALNLKDPPITGHPDMFLKRRSGAVRLVEFKTIEGDAFEKLVAPLVSHRWQISAYMWACSLSRRIPEIDTKYGYVFYFAKKQSAGSFPVKAFPVRLTDDVMGPIKKKLDLYRDGLAGAPVPLHSDCELSKWEHWRARMCPVLSHCGRELC
jgi:hypothetical protein